ncbi:MAG: ABC transporter ATP-binding protein/permease [Treponema sp.]|jgi:ATP-binding cassette subfamily C protein|nr:ABC transporter ATP-binding protein/permease [Treponema sp.]
MKPTTGAPVSIFALSRRLFRIAGAQKHALTISTLASIFGNFAHLGLMASGALLILSCAGLADGRPVVWGALMFICSAAIGICRYEEGVVSHVAAYKLLADMRGVFYEALCRLAPARLLDRQKGDILSIAVADIETIEFFFAHTIGPLFTIILLPLLTLCIAASVNLLFLFVLLPVYIIICIALPLLAIKTGRAIGRDYRERIGDLKSFMVESVSSLKEIQIFNYGERRMSLAMEKTRGINHSAHALTLHRQMVTSAPVFFVYLARILVIAVASYLALGRYENPAGVIILSFVVSASFSSTQSLTTVISNLLETYAAAERYFAVIDDRPEIIEDPAPVDIESIESIEFDKVSFGYRKAEPIIQDLSFVIKKGENIGIIGESGAGKSTIIRLLLRFWEPTAGEIRINDIPLKKISLKSLRSRIAMLEQETIIFNDTIAANIALGKIGANREEIILSAKRAHIHEFISALPDGYQTPMGELNGRISGGERQRIGIARAMLSNPDMLVMDEPTSNLDVLNEKSLLKTLNDEYGDKTLLIVSHRRSTLTNCGSILHIEKTSGALQNV